MSLEKQRHKKLIKEGWKHIYNMGLCTSVRHQIWLYKHHVCANSIKSLYFTAQALCPSIMSSIKLVTWCNNGVASQLAQRFGLCNQTEKWRLVKRPFAGPKNQFALLQVAASTASVGVGAMTGEKVHRRQEVTVGDGSLRAQWTCRWCSGLLFSETPPLIIDWQGRKWSLCRSGTTKDRTWQTQARCMIEMNLVTFGFFF